MRLLLFLSGIVAASSLSASRITTTPATSTTPSTLAQKVASFRDRAPLPDLRNGLVGGLIACGVVLGGCEQAEALQPADVVELTDAALEAYSFPDGAYWRAHPEVIAAKGWCCG